MHSGNVEAANILRPGAPLAGYSDQTFAALQGPLSPASTLALHTLHATLAGVLPGNVYANPVHRNRLAVSVFDLAHQYAQLAASLATANATDGAAATALLVESAQVLDALGTPLSRNMMLLLLNEVNYAVLSAMANRPSVAARAVETLVALTSARLGQTGSWFYAGSDERYESEERTRPCEHFDASFHCVSAYRRNPDYPYDALPIAAFGFLGTEQGPALRQGIVDFLLKADKGLGLLIDLHDAHIGAAGVAKPRMSAQGDLARFLSGLAGFELHDHQGYSAALAFTQVAAIFEAVLAKVETPSMFRLLADCALTAIDRYADGGIRNDAGDSAAVQLLERLSKRGPDREINAQLKDLVDARLQRG